MRSRPYRLWAVLVAAVFVATAESAEERRQGESYPYSAGHFVILLDGEPMGFPKSVSGGRLQAERMTRSAGPHRTGANDAGVLAAGPITLQIGMGMGKDLYEWIQASFAQEHIRKSGAIVAADFNYSETSRREFQSAHIAEVKFGKLDASGQDATYMTVKLKPEEIRYRKGTGKTVQGPRAAPHKQWLCSNFRVEIGGMPTQRVSKIDSFSVKLAPAEDSAASFRAPRLHPLKVELPNLKFTVSMADLEPWRAWFDGAATTATPGRVDGAITYLAPDRKTALARLGLSGLAPVSLKVASGPLKGDGPATFTAVLSCERMSFTYLAE